MIDSAINKNTSITLYKLNNKQTPFYSDMLFSYATIINKYNIYLLKKYNLHIYQLKNKDVIYLNYKCIIDLLENIHNKSNYNNILYSMFNIKN